MMRCEMKKKMWGCQWPTLKGDITGERTDIERFKKYFYEFQFGIARINTTFD